MSNTQKTEAEAVAQIVMEAPRYSIADVDGRKLLITQQSQQVADLTDKLAKHLPYPERRTGHINVARLSSFHAITNRYKQEDSIIFASGSMKKDDDELNIAAQATTIFNPHPAGSDPAKAGHGDFKAQYKFPVDKTFLKWVQMDGDGMDGEDFARFIEDRIADIGGLHLVNAAQINQALTGKGAEPVDMLQLSRGLEVRVNESVKDVRRLPSGEVSLSYSVEHQGADGQPLVVPTWFVVNVPVFEGDLPVAIVARLRYRVSGGRVTWKYELYQLEDRFDEAFNLALTVIREETGLPIYIVE